MLLKDLFDIDSFQSFFEKGGWFSINENLQSVLNALLNIAFGLIKYLVLALDYVIDKLFSLNLLEGVLPDLFSTTGAIYNKLRSEERRVGKECRCWGRSGDDEDTVNCC